MSPVQTGVLMNMFSSGDSRQFLTVLRTTSTFLSSRGVGSYTDDEEDSTDDDSLNEESGSEEEEDGYSEDVLHSESWGIYLLLDCT